MLMHPSPMAEPSRPALPKVRLSIAHAPVSSEDVAAHRPSKENDPPGCPSLPSRSKMAAFAGSSRTTLGPDQEHGAKGGHPESPTGAPDQAREVEHGKPGVSRCHNVPLIEQIEHAHNQSGDT